MKKMIGKLTARVAFAFALAFGLTAQAATIYVSTSGDDTNGNGSQVSPYATLTKGLAVAANGDTIHMLAGTYDGAGYSITKSVTIEGDVQGGVPVAKLNNTSGGVSTETIDIGATDLTVVITNMAFVSAGGGSHHAVHMCSKTGCTVSILGCTISDGMQYTTAGAPNGSSFVVDGCTIVARDGSAVSLCGNVTYRNNVISNVSNSTPVDGFPRDTITFENNEWHIASGYADTHKAWARMGTTDKLVIDEGSTVAIKMSDRSGSQDTFDDAYPFRAQIVSAGTLTISDANTLPISGALSTTGSGTISITGGTYTYDPSAYVASGYEAVANGTSPETWTVQLYQPKVAQVISADGVTTNTYATLTAAVTAAAAGNTVRLLDDVSLAEAVTINKTLTLDFGGFTLDSDGLVLNLDAAATLTLRNGVMTGNAGAISVTQGSGRALVLDGVEILAYGADAVAWAGYAGSITLADDSFNVIEAQSDGCDALYFYDGYYDHFTISGNGVLEISGKYAGIHACYQTAYISAPNVYASGYAAYGFSQYGTGEYGVNGISAGFYDTDVSAYCADGKAALANTDPETQDAYPYEVRDAAAYVIHDSTKTCYGTLAEALAAVQSGDTLGLFQNVTGSIAANVAMTLDLNGRKLDGALTANAALSVKDSSGTGVFAGSVSVGEGGSLAVYGGTFSTDVSAYVAEGYGSAQEGAWWHVGRLDTWASKVNQTYAWYANDPDAESFTISTEQDLAAFAALLNGEGVTNGVSITTPVTFAGKTVTLADDLNLTSKAWKPAGTGGWCEWYDQDSNTYYGQGCFAGTFNGNGHTIAYSMSETNAYFCGYGLFGYIEGGTVLNLTLDIDMNFPTPYYQSDFDTPSGLLRVVYAQVAGLAFQTVDALIQDVTANGTITNKSYSGQSAGIVSVACGGSVFRRCVNNVDVFVGQYYRSATSSSYTLAGGIISQTSSTTGSPVKLYDCVNNGDIAMPSTYDNEFVNYDNWGGLSYQSYNSVSGRGVARMLNAGGMVGQISNNGYVLYLEGCVQNGSILGANMDVCDVNVEGLFVSQVVGGGFNGRAWRNGLAEPQDNVITNSYNNDSEAFYRNHVVYLVESEPNDLTLATFKSVTGGYADGAYYKNGGYIYRRQDNAGVKITEDEIPALNKATELVGATVYNSSIVIAPQAIARIVEMGVKYTSLADAMAVVQDGQTVEMLATDTLTNSISCGKSFTLDLNGQAIDGDNKYGFVLTGAAITIKDSSGDDSGKITHCTKSGAGDGLGAIKYSNSSGTLTLESGSICSNSAAGNSGAAIFMSSGNLVMNGGKIFDNVNTAGTGGAIGQSTGTFTMNGGVISGNSSRNRGGGIVLNTNGKMIMNGGEIVDNVSSSQGGGVHLATSTAEFTMNGGVISGNRAAKHGGGLMVEEGKQVTITGGVIANNRTVDASQHGGGMRVSCSLTITGGVFTNNVSTGRGGGIWVNKASTISNCLIADNTAGSTGGGIQVSGGTVTIEPNVVISGNKGVKGGGMEVESSSAVVNVNGAQFLGNDALTQDGGAIYIAQGTVNFADGLIDANNTGANIYGNGRGIWQNNNADAKLNISGGTIDASVWMHCATTGSAITGGKFNAFIKCNAANSTSVTLQGGIFTEYAKTNTENNSAFSKLIPLTQAFVANTDEETKVAYPWTIGPDIVNVATIGNTKYLTLGLAMADAKVGDTVKLLNATDESVEMATGVKFDKNSKDYTGKLSAPDGSFIRDNGDGTYDSLVLVAEIRTATATNRYESLTVACSAVKGGETITLVKANYTNELTLAVSCEHAFVLDLNGFTLMSDVTVSAGSITLTNGNLKASSAGAAVTVAGGTFTLVQGAYVTGATGVAVNSGTFAAYDGFVTATNGSAVAFKRGVTNYIAGGTFVASEGQKALAVVDGGTGDYPSAFIYPQMDGAAETGFPLFSSTISSDYAALGYKVRDNGNGTWTVTAGTAEIKVVVNEDIVPTVETNKVSDLTGQEQKSVSNAVADIKQNLVDTLEDPDNEDLSGTGVDDAMTMTNETGTTIMRGYVYDAITNEVPEADREYIKSNNTVTSYVKVELKSFTVTVETNTTKTTEAGARVLESTLTTIKYDIKPVVTTVYVKNDVTNSVTTTIPEGTLLASPITFRLWLEETFVGSVVSVQHKHENGKLVDTKTYIVQRDEKGQKYVDLTWDQFSIALIEAFDVTGKACWAGVDKEAGGIYDTLADALTNTVANYEVFLLQDCAENDLVLKDNQTINLNGHALTGSITPEGGTANKDVVTTKSGLVYCADKAVNVRPVAGNENTLPIRGYSEFPAEVTTDADKQAYLEALNDNGVPRWQAYVMGMDEKLLPRIVGANVGFSQVTICAQEGFTVSTPERCGVEVSFNLLKKDAGEASFTQYITNSLSPSFAVDVKDIADKTFWKIQTVFESIEKQ